MVNAAERINSLVLSAAEIKALTNWPDPIVEDYLNIINNFANIAVIIDVNEESITSQINEILQDKESIRLFVLKNKSMVVKNIKLIQKNKEKINDLEQVVYAW